MLQAVKGDPQAFSKLTAHSFLEKGVKNKQISKRKKPESLLAACGELHRVKGTGKGGAQGRLPLLQPLCSSQHIAAAGFPWKPQAKSGGTPASPAPAPAGEGASAFTATAASEQNVWESTRKGAGKPHGARKGSRQGARPVPPPGVSAPTTHPDPGTGSAGAAAPTNVHTPGAHRAALRHPWVHRWGLNAQTMALGSPKAAPKKPPAGAGSLGAG